MNLTQTIDRLAIVLILLGSISYARRLCCIQQAFRLVDDGKFEKFLSLKLRPITAQLAVVYTTNAFVAFANLPNAPTGAGQNILAA